MRSMSLSVLGAGLLSCGMAAAQAVPAAPPTPPQMLQPRFALGTRAAIRDGDVLAGPELGFSTGLGEGLTLRATIFAARSPDDRLGLGGHSLYAGTLTLGYRFDFELDQTAYFFEPFLGLSITLDGLDSSRGPPLGSSSGRSPAERWRIAPTVGFVLGMRRREDFGENVSITGSFL